MTGLYIFLLAAGGPVLLWLVFAGDADSDSGGDLFSVIPLSSIAFFAATFGFVGVVGGVTGAGAAALFVTSAVVAVLAGLMSSQVFKWLRKNSVSSEVMASDLEGSMARVALEVSSDRRGKIIVDMAGAREQMTASPIDGSTISEGERVVVVKVERGVALVAPLGPDLRLE